MSPHPSQRRRRGFVTPDPRSGELVPPCRVPVAARPTVATPGRQVRGTRSRHVRQRVTPPVAAGCGAGLGRSAARWQPIRRLVPVCRRTGDGRRCGRWLLRVAGLAVRVRAMPSGGGFAFGPFLLGTGRRELLRTGEPVALSL